MKDLQNDIMNLDKATPVPFPFPLQQNLNYVYTLDLDTADLTVSFAPRRRGRGSGGSSDNEASQHSLNQGGFRLEYGGFAAEWKQSTSRHIPAAMFASSREREYEHWKTEVEQASTLNELQYRMFMDFVYQWRFFIDDRTAWERPSSTLFRRLCSAFLRLAVCDFEISSKWEIAKLPLDAETFPSWDSPSTEVYWFHGSLVVLCEELETPSSISASVSRAREFVGHSGGRGNEVNCIFISLDDIAFIQVSAHKIRSPTVFPLLIKSSATECSADFRILTYFLTSPYVKERACSARSFKHRSSCGSHWNFSQLRPAS